MHFLSLSHLFKHFWHASAILVSPVGRTGYIEENCKGWMVIRIKSRSLASFWWFFGDLLSLERDTVDQWCSQSCEIHFCRSINQGGFIQSSATMIAFFFLSRSNRFVYLFSFSRYFVTVKISYLQPYKVRTFTTCVAFPPWCSRYTVHNKVAFKTEVKFKSYVYIFSRNEKTPPDIRWKSPFPLRG